MKEQKKALRHRVKKSLQTLSDIRKKELSILVQNNIRSFLQENILIHENIGLYYPLEDEVDPIYDRNQSFFFPRMNSEDEMRFYAAKLTELKEQVVFGKTFKEPQIRESEEVIKAYMVPGLAFTRKGKRLGRGKGYYDKYFERIERSSRDILKIGICFEEQIFEEEEIQTESHDIRMDFIITPLNIYEASSP